MKKWVCNVCGYIHEGETPPRTCPICSAPSSEFTLQIEEKKEKDRTTGRGKIDTGANTKQVLPGFVERNIVLKFLAGHFPLYQFHPIMAHFPNGLIPTSVFFLVLGILFNFQCVEKTAFYILCAATAAAPFTVITGIYNWKTRYKGAITSKFMFKLYGGIILTVLCAVTVVWRLIRPDVVDTSPGVYFIINLVILGMVTMVGHIGGKLVFVDKR